MKKINGFVVYTIKNTEKTYLLDIVQYPRVLMDIDSDEWNEEKEKSFIFESFEDAVVIVTKLSNTHPENIYGTEPFDKASFNEYCSQTVSTWINSEGV